MKIDIRSLVESKRPHLAKILPNAVYTLIGRIINLDEINRFLSLYGDRYGIDYADAMVQFLDISFDVRGEENLPDPSERCIFASNHPLGGPDGVAMIAYFGRRYPSIKFPVNDFLMSLNNLNDVFLPINKHGALGRQAVLELDAAYASDSQILMFPAGLVSRKSRRGIYDLEWKKHFVAKAWAFDRKIVPVHISGENSKLFYRVANWRKRLRIGTNLEMFLLPRETFKKSGSAFTMTIGRPLDGEELRSISNDPYVVAQELRRRVYCMT